MNVIHQGVVKRLMSPNTNAMPRVPTTIRVVCASAEPPSLLSMLSAWLLCKKILPPALVTKCSASCGNGFLFGGMVKENRELKSQRTTNWEQFPVDLNKLSSSGKISETLHCVSCGDRNNARAKLIEYPINSSQMPRNHIDLKQSCTICRHRIVFFSSKFKLWSYLFSHFDLFFSRCLILILRK